MFDEPGIYDTKIIQGDVWDIPFYFYLDVGETEPFDLTGYTGQLVIEEPVNITLSTSSSGLVIGGTAGSVTPTLTPSQTAVPSAGVEPHWYMVLTDASGNPGTPINGTMVWTAR